MLGLNPDLLVKLKCNNPIILGQPTYASSKIRIKSQKKKSVDKEMSCVRFCVRLCVISYDKSDGWPRHLVCAERDFYIIYTF